jgi:hypothetical protein
MGLKTEIAYYKNLNFTLSIHKLETMISRKLVFYRVDGYGDQFCFMDGGTDPQPVFACSKVLLK